MSVFSANIKFRYPWRSYQQRVLDELSSHMDDSHLHVIAPPGSGKTVLGLEVMLRLGQPTLILAPTHAIRNQWIQRFTELFVQQQELPDYISKDIRHPKRITVVTYQGLHAACNDRKEGNFTLDYVDETDIVEKTRSNFLNLPKIISGLQGQGVQTFILDEAHHLKNEWWQTLDRLKKAINPKMVGLTATPPYDVSGTEWSRYLDLNGPIDAEITVPELIQQGDLCPHQDYVYCCQPSAEELQLIRSYRTKAVEIFEEIKNDESLIRAISTHPSIVDPLGNEFKIHENLAFYSACLIFLRSRSIEISPLHFELLGIPHRDDSLQLPDLDFSWMEELLRNYLFEDKGHFKHEFEEERTLMLNRLRRLGIVERRSIKFEQGAKILQHLHASVSKLTAIEQISNFEFGIMGGSLRQVILTDFVRKEYLANTPENTIPLRKIGVLPIFEQLRRNNGNQKKIGVLSGTIVIVPQTAVDSLEKAYSPFGHSEALNIKPLVFDTSYYIIQVTDQSRDWMVAIVTRLFEAGEIEILIGTKALLGEGWDAPAINSLILASVVGSFVSSNQMRGRAIRTNLNVPDKTSNIWHIACVDSTVVDGGQEIALLRRRFRNFVGLVEDERGGIENGLSRISFPTEVNEENITQFNGRSFVLAGQRRRLPNKWQAAIAEGTQLLEEIKLPFVEPDAYQGMKAAEMKRTIGNMTASLGSAVVFYLEWSTQISMKLMKWLGAPGGTLMLGMFGVGTVFFSARAIKTFRYYAKYRDVTKDIYEIGNALIKTLCKSRIFTTSLKDLRVLTYADRQGAVFCHLDGGTTYEKSLFVQMIQEVVEPINSPRYIIVRKSLALKVLRQYDYHAVPEMLGKRAALANDFANFWREEVGSCQLIFTKNMEGRKLLIRSKVAALANHFSEDTTVQHVNIWR